MYCRIDSLLVVNVGWCVFDVLLCCSMIRCCLMSVRMLLWLIWICLGV